MKLGLYYVLSVPYVAGFACFGGPTVGGFRLTGWLFAVVLAAAPLVFVADSTPSRFPIGMWMPWILVVTLSLSWASPLGLSNIQNVCQIVTPFAVAPIASKSIKREKHLDSLFTAFVHCLLILLLALILHRLMDVEILPRPMAMTAAIVGCVFIARVRERPVLAIVGWSGCLGVASLTGSRMATFVILLEWLILPRYRRHFMRLIAFVLISILAVTLFYTPMFQERFFLDEEGTLGDLPKGQFFTSGRFEAWPELWQEVARRPVLGAGAHSSAPLVRSVWETMSHPHNDYLRILLEQGFVGLFCFAVGVIAQLMSLWHGRSSGSQDIAVVRSAAYMGVLVMLLMAMTDNPIIYGVWFMHPLFVLIGASYSPVARGDEAQRTPRSRPTGDPRR